MELILGKLEGLAAELRSNHYSREELDVFAHKIEAAVTDIRNNSGASDAVIKSEPEPEPDATMDPVSPIQHIEELGVAAPDNTPGNPPLSTGADVKEPVKSLFDSE